MSPSSAGSDLQPDLRPVVVQVEELTRAGEARRSATSMAAELGFDHTATGRLALVVTEMATNIARHGGGGFLVLRVLDHGSGVEVLAADRGAGMADVERAMRDGFSTGGTSGTGLGAIRRLADEFDVYSAPGVGTVLLARLLGLRPAIPVAASAREPMELGVVSVPAPGEWLCGDAWAAADTPDGYALTVIDGLGHGPGAREAAELAVRAFRARLADGPAEIIAEAHRALRGTRGATMGVARIDRDRGLVRFSGAGNISCSVVQPTASQSLASMNGTVGFELRHTQEFETPWTPASAVVMHSDGIGTRWRLDHFPGLLGRHASLIACVLYRDFARGRDDATILVARERRPPATADAPAVES